MSSLTAFVSFSSKLKVGGPHSTGGSFTSSTLMRNDAVNPVCVPSVTSTVTS